MTSDQLRAHRRAWRWLRVTWAVGNVLWWAFCLALGAVAWFLVRAAYQ